MLQHKSVEMAPGSDYYSVLFLGLICFVLSLQFEYHDFVYTS